MHNDSVSLNGCDPNTIHCKDCKWAHVFEFSQFTSKSCAKYKEKPDEVYYESANCPKFEKY